MILAPFGGRTPRRLACGLRLAQALPVTQLSRVCVLVVLWSARWAAFVVLVWLPWPMFEGL